MPNLAPQPGELLEIGLVWEHWRCIIGEWWVGERSLLFGDAVQRQTLQFVGVHVERMCMVEDDVQCLASGGIFNTPDSSRAASLSSTISAGTANADFTGTLIASGCRLRS